MRTDFTASPVNNLKSGGKAVRDESARVGLSQAKSARAEGDDAEGDFSALLMTLGGDGASAADVSTTQTPSRDVSATDAGREEKSSETNQPPVVDEATARGPGESYLWESVPGLVSELVSGGRAVLPGMAQAAAAETMLRGMTGIMNAPIKGVSPTGLTSIKDIRSQPGAVPTTPDPTQAGALLSATVDANADASTNSYVSSAAVALHGKASGSVLNSRDSKNDPSYPVPGHGVDGRSDVSLVTDKPEVMPLSSKALEGWAQKMAPKTPTTVEGGAWGAQPFQLADNRMTGALVSDAGGDASDATAIAQQVSYWIGRDVQSAELKLDGLGRGPVEVSISLHGREAHVEFRSEQAQTRQLIEQAMPQLKSLLQSEGLTLVGVSIGASGAEASFSQAKQSQPAPRRGGRAMPELAMLDVGGQARPATGRALDLFV